MLTVPSSLSITTTGNGVVTGSAAPQVFNAVYQDSSSKQAFTTGTSISLAAQPAAGYAFTGWTGACTGTATTCSFVLNTSKTVSATFITTPVIVVPPPVVTPPVVTSITTPVVTPTVGSYLYIFGVSPLGTTDFNVYQNSSQSPVQASNFVGPLQTGVVAPVDDSALSAALDKKYTVVSKSVAEADAKANLLKTVTLNVGGEGMMYANIQAAMNGDEVRNELSAVNSKSWKVGVCSYDVIDGSNESGCSSGAGTTDDKQIVVPSSAGYGYYKGTKVVGSPTTDYTNPPVPCPDPSIPNLPIPMVVGDFKAPASNLDKVQEKLVILAKNNLPPDVVGIFQKPVGESGAISVQFNNGKLVTVWVAGVDGKIGPPTYNQAVQLSNDVVSNTNWLIKPIKIYNFHTHDINSTLSVLGQNGLTGAVPPSLADLQMNVHDSKMWAGAISLPLITRVISPSGIGYEFSVPNGSDIYNKISNLNSEPDHNTTPELFMINHAYTAGFNCSMIRNKRTKAITQDYMYAEANAFAIYAGYGIGLQRFKVR